MLVLETPLSAAQLASRALSVSAKLFLLALTAPELRGDAATVEQLGARVGMPERTAYRAVAELKELGLVEWLDGHRASVRNGGTLVYCGNDYYEPEPLASVPQRSWLEPIKLTVGIKRAGV